MTQKNVPTLMKASLLLLSLGATTAISAANILKRSTANRPVQTRISTVDNAASKPAKTAGTPADETVDPKRMTYITPDTYFTYTNMGVVCKGEMDVYARYTGKMLTLFGGNKVKTINLVVDENATKVTVFVKDSKFYTVFEKEVDATQYEGFDAWHTGHKYGHIISVDIDCDFTVGDEEFYVGYNQQVIGTPYAYVLLQQGAENGNAYMIDVHDGNGLRPASKTYGATAAIWVDTEGAAGLSGNDVVMNPLGDYRVLAGGEYLVSGTVTTYGTEPVNSITFEYDMPDGSKGESTVTSPEPLPYMNTITFNVNLKSGEQAGSFVRNVGVSKINGTADDRPEDNYTTSGLIAIDNPAERTAVMELITSRGCVWCPRGLVAESDIKKMFGDKAFTVEIHNNDGELFTFDADAYSPVISRSNGEPWAILNRVISGDPWGEIGLYPDAEFPMGELIKNILEKQPVEASVDARLTLNADKSAIDVESATTFTLPIDEASDRYRLAYLLLENGLKGIQANSYSSEAGYPFPDDMPESSRFLYDLPKYYECEYNNVVRDFDGVMGIAGSLAGKVEKGGTLTHSTSLSTATLTDIERAAVAVFLIDSKSGEIINAKCVELNPALNGIGTVSAQAPYGIGRNADGSISIDAPQGTCITICSVDGRTVKSAIANDKTIIDTTGMHGVYIVSMESKAGKIVKKITLK